ncbi:MAG: hypothetical protein JXA78_03240 [Anaerolineales bacterium]|nr:hypothetical protein [Anaerolineales bacterium]
MAQTIAATVFLSPQSNSIIQCDIVITLIDTPETGRFFSGPSRVRASRSSLLSGSLLRS